MKKLIGGLAATALVVLAAPAWAVPFTYGFTTTGSDTSTSGANGNAKTYSASDGSGHTVQVRATAYAANDQNSAVSSAHLGAYDHGLGVTNGADDFGGLYNFHTVDNVGSTDFVVLQFDTAVKMTAATLSPFEVPYLCGSNICYSTDSDATAFYGTTGTNWQTNLSFGTISSLTSGHVNIKGGSAEATDAVASPDAYYNLWIVSADLFNQWDSNPDGFKLKGFTVTSQPPGAVPEPATWAMMIAGFGFVGASLRRRNRKAALAA